MLAGGGADLAYGGGREHEVELATVDVDAGDADLDPVAQPVPDAGTPADERVGAGFEVVEVVGQAGDVDQALDGQLDELAEQAEVLDADDDRVERLADLSIPGG